ncbi:hypothetical protein [Pandoraea capi]|uniref:hypothetical protein n=1 Tax=Pandoraea capi TaxID=2508286 RepID=UPI001FE6A176|nr:hypothetical protein [Pandoraea capi]
MQQHEAQAAVTEQATAAATTPAAAFAALTTTFVAAPETPLTIAFATAAPSMTPTASFVAKIHFVQVQRAPAHEIAT